jgi:hypothetical protein
MHIKQTTLLFYSFMATHANANQLHTHTSYSLFYLGQPGHATSAGESVLRTGFLSKKLVGLNSNEVVNSGIIGKSSCAGT